MAVRIDLHTHSTVSDGTESPAELVRAAAATGLEAVALTDHDSTAGWAEATEQAERCGIELVPGMEVTCQDPRGISVHLLSYLQDPRDEALLGEIERTRRARRVRARLMVELLAEDYPITWDDVLAQAGRDATVGRPHIADALVAAGVAPNRSAVFATILGGGSPYYVPHRAIDAVRAVRLVRAAGGVPVFAHPVASARGRVVGEETFEAMVEEGLAGVEVHHRDNPEAGRRWLLDLAARHDLLVTGSSDYHGEGKPNRLGENTTDPEVLAAIREMAGRKPLNPSGG